MFHIDVDYRSALPLCSPKKSAPAGIRRIQSVIGKEVMQSFATGTAQIKER